MSSVICCALVIAIAVADQLIKLAVLDSSLVSGQVFTVIDNFLQFRYVENTGAAFSLFEGKTVLLAVFSAIVMAVGFYILIARKLKSKVLAGKDNAFSRTCNNFFKIFYIFMRSHKATYDISKRVLYSKFLKTIQRRVKII